jgi:hypothetical protein
VKNVPPVVAAADTVVVAAAVDTAVVVVDTAVVVVADMVVAEAVVAPVALVATAADIAKTSPTVLRMGVESNLHPHFLFTNLTVFLFAILPVFPICHHIVTTLPHLSRFKIISCLVNLTLLGGCFTPLAPFLLQTDLKKVRTFFFATGQT